MSLSLEQKLANLAFFSSLFLHPPKGNNHLFSGYSQVENVLWLQLGCQTGYFDPVHVGEVLEFLEDSFVVGCGIVLASGGLDAFGSERVRLLIKSAANANLLDRNLLDLSPTFDRADDSLPSAFQNYVLLARELTDEPRISTFLSLLRFADHLQWPEILNSGSPEDGLSPRDVVLATVSALQFLDDMHETRSGDQFFDLRIREIQRWKLDLAEEGVRQRFFDAIHMVRDRTTERFNKTSRLEIASLIERQGRILAADWSGIEFNEEIEVERGTQQQSRLQGKSEIGEVQNLLQRNIEELELSVRSYNAIKNLGINTISDLVNMSRTEMERRGVQRKSLAELQEILGSMGLEWKGTGGETAEREHERPRAELEGAE